MAFMAESFATQSGMLKSPKDKQEAARLSHAATRYMPEVMQWLDATESAERTGRAPQHAGLWMEQGMWLEPPRWCQDLLQHENIMLHYERALKTLSREGDAWCLTFSDGRKIIASQVILALANESAAFVPELAPKLRASAGQVSVIPASEVKGPLPKTILCHKGYVIPAGDSLVIGATFDREDLSLKVTPQNHRYNAEEANAASQDVVGEVSSTWHGRTSLRATTRDRLPLAGEVAPGLWVNTGHGARGMLSAPYAAAAVAAALTGEPMPMQQSMWQALSPLR